MNHTKPYANLSPFPITSLRSVTVGSGRGFLEGDTRRGQARELLECADEQPRSARSSFHHSDAISVEVQGVRGGDAIPRVTTRRPIDDVPVNVVQHTTAGVLT